MKILHVIAGMNPNLGGVSQAVRTMCTELSKQGIYNEVTGLDSPGEPFLLNEPALIHMLGPAKTPWSYGAKFRPWLVDNLHRFDIVLLHGLWLYHGYALRKAIQACRSQSGNEARPRFFIMPHGMLDPYFQQAPGRKMKALRNWLYWQLIESKVINEADGLLFTCEEEKQLAREPFHPYKPKSEIVVGLGVEEPPVYTPAMREAFLEKCPELSDTPYILFLSRINQKKGVDLLVKAYQQIVNHYATAEVGISQHEALPDEEVRIPRLLIAGPGLDTLYGQAVQQLAQADQAQESAISFVNMLSGDAKWGAFYGCEAFVLSSHQENFGIAVVEALACGKPVLISNQVNIWREIDQSCSGFVAPDTIDGVYQVIQQWLNLSMAEKQQMSKNALETFQKTFSIVLTTQHLIDVFST
ncbi:glycosyltransferase [Spirosoma radiotolerans]|uniref:Glycosyl transferase family 1 n=1 Tax=Spirosoma radiotolerans TaxID=1379870 RepID=A0A0E3V908_9BACT|nr:glycosyltransferase [Spirosoma radiotolerans]AKD57247.1 glycosyl transferase family 1 [Spirosoma radiotolerans]